MPYRLECQIGGWGAVRNPLDESESVPVEDDAVVVEERELAHALEAEYGALNLVEEPSEAVAETDDAFDAESFLDRIPMTTVVEDIESGEADEHLDALAEQADRQGVQDAISDRQDEL